MIISMEEKLKAAAYKAIESMKKNAETERENKKLNIYIQDLK